jgi:CTP-dependent riboflavin kinase
MPIELEGKLCSGLGDGAAFIRLEWVVREIREKLGFAPYPGTVNLSLTGHSWVETSARLRQAAGIAINPAPGFCAAKCFEAVLNDTVKGAVILPEVSGYPADKLEIVAPVGVKRELKLQDGDCVKLRIDIE